MLLSITSYFDGFVDQCSNMLVLGEAEGHIYVEKNAILTISFLANTEFLVANLGRSSANSLGVRSLNVPIYPQY